MAIGAAQHHGIRQYNIVWDSQSKNSSESMPVNGHSLGANVWVENGEIYFYAAQSGAFDENNESLKMGRFRVKLKPNPFNKEDKFQQELKLKEGYINITSKHSEIGETEVKIWVEAERPVIHFEAESDTKLIMKVSYETWRAEDVLLDAEKVPGVRGRRASLFDYDNYLVDLIKYGDHFSLEDDKFYFFHNNDDHFSAFDFAIEQQGLQDIKGEMYNPLKNLISGGMLLGENLQFVGNSNGFYSGTPYKSWNFENASSSKNTSFQVFAIVDHSKNVQEWKNEIHKLADIDRTEEEIFKQNLEWWKSFWQRSFIILNEQSTNKETDKAWEAGRNYNLFRYQLGGNTYGLMPTKFNGGNLTFDPVLVDKNFNYDPDYRRWGGGSFTAQNQRLVYWPMLKSGDFEAILPQFEFYRRALSNAVNRTEHYWGHTGSSFTEQMQQSGLPIASHYGFVHDAFWITQRPLNYEEGKQSNRYVQTLFQTQLEFAFMILEYYKYSGNDISEYLPFIYNAVIFYDEHYQFRHRQETGKALDKNGKLVLYPTTPGENSPNSTNASDAIAGLTAVIQNSLELPQKVLPDSIRNYFEDLKNRIPDLEKFVYTDDSGKEHTLLRESKEDIAWHSGFMPSLYALFPYRLINSETEDFEYAQNVWKYKMNEENKNNYASWRPGVFMGANLLLTNYTKEQLLKKLGNSQRKYPTFWGPGHDWVPDHNWGGSGMIGLQDMLLQEKGEKIYLLPTWPKEWDVHFRLHAYKNTIIELNYFNGQIQQLTVTPESRKKDIILEYK
ncbi:hypothetical protein DHD80_14610 [Gramella sp. AN32]|nr:hypothetical protein [Gramella sp. AN32]